MKIPVMLMLAMLLVSAGLMHAPVAAFANDEVITPHSGGVNVGDHHLFDEEEEQEVSEQM